jgi:hypothetical protein
MSTKPSNAPAKPAPDDDDDRPTAPLSMVNRLKVIDVSSLDKLTAFRRDQKRLEEFRARAEERKTGVADAVYKRVLADYAKREAVLETQSAPLRTQARAEYGKLKALVEDLTRTVEQTRLEKDELEFRHAVGELTDQALAEKLKGPRLVFDQYEADRAEVDKCKARFVEAFGAEEALDAPEPPSKPPPAAAAAPAKAPGVQESAAPVAARPSASAPASPAVGRPAPVGDVTERTPLPVPAAIRPAAPDPAAPRPASTAPPAPPHDAPKEAARGSSAPNAGGDEGATMVMAMAALVNGDLAASPREYALGPLNGIGRAEENQIQMTSSGVSRKHAVITAVSGGFAIRDLGSQNGTYVNGERVTERKLADGDASEIGSARFVFRMPWPPAAGQAPRGAAGVKPPAKR